MKQKIMSEVTGIMYCPSDTVRILNPAQAAFYASEGVKLVDLYPSLDFKTGNPVLVFLYNRKESSQAYDTWCNRRKNNIKSEDQENE